MTDHNDQPLDPREMAHQYAQPLIRSGFETLEHTCQCVEESLEDDFDDIENLDEFVQEVVQNEINQLQAEQQHWNHPTDCERLDNAFKELNEIGILARHHYTCCRTCGVFEIDLDLDYLNSNQHSYHGYAFYNVQDTESAVYGTRLALSYGDAHDSEKNAPIGHEICKILNKHDLQTTWEGDDSKRIFVELDWNRPWPPKEPDAVLKPALEKYRLSVEAKKRAEQANESKKPKGIIAWLKNKLS